MGRLLGDRLGSISSSRLGSISSNRLDSISSQHLTRLDSQGSTIGSSHCESIPRTESDYQRKVDEEAEQGPLYTNSSIQGDLIFRLSSESSLTLSDSLQDLTCEERCQSGSYVNYDSRLTWQLLCFEWSSDFVKFLQRQSDQEGDLY